MERMRLDILTWSEFVKVTKFARQIGVSPQAVSSWIKYGVSSLSEEKKIELYNTIKDYLRKVA